MCQSSTWKPRLRASAAWSLGQIPANRGGDRKSMLKSNTAEPRELHSLAEDFKDPSAKCREQGKNTAWQALKVVFFLTQVTADTKMSIKGTTY